MYALYMSIPPEKYPHMYNKIIPLEGSVVLAKAYHVCKVSAIPQDLTA